MNKKKTPHKPVKYTEEEVQELIEEAIKGIRADKNIIYISEVIELLGISTATFYVYFPKDGEIYKEFMNELETNRVRVKKEIRDKLLNIKQATALIALYRLIGTQEERDRLNPSMDGSAADKEKMNVDKIELKIG